MTTEFEHTQGYNEDLLPGYKANCSYQLGHYGEDLRVNKWHVRRAFDSVRLHPDLRAMFFGMAFQETTHMTSSQRDASKDDCAYGSANWSLWNLSEDLLRELGYRGGDFRSLNETKELPRVVDLMRKGVHRWGAFRFLAFVRGGRTGFEDGVSYGVKDFVSSIATHMMVLQQDDSLFWDDRRIEIDVDHV